MKPIPRYLTPNITADLGEKMVFVGGPRQVGKTTLALQFLDPPHKQHSAYLNWDISADRERIRKNQLPTAEPLLVLDEVHKHRRWRQLLKGLFDEFHPQRRFLVTGSARLDAYRRGGDSLHGRYHYWRLHPLTIGELPKSALDDLLQYGGFPEPFLKANRRFWRRWNRERLDRVVREDLRDLEQVREVGLIELLVDALPDRVGSLLSLNALAEDIEVSPRTIDRWLRILETLYVCFRIPPFGASKLRAVKKASKLYLWDWAAVKEEGPRFENMVASHLLKYCHFVEDAEGYKMELRYLRDRAGREVDFVVLRDRKPLFAVECKTSDNKPVPTIKYFRQRTRIPKFYQVHLQSRAYGDPAHEGAMMPFAEFAEFLHKGEV